MPGITRILVATDFSAQTGALTSWVVGSGRAPLPA